MISQNDLYWYYYTTQRKKNVASFFQLYDLLYHSPITFLFIRSGLKVPDLDTIRAADCALCLYREITPKSSHKNGYLIDDLCLHSKVCQNDYFMSYRPTCMYLSSWVFSITCFLPLFIRLSASNKFTPLSGARFSQNWVWFCCVGNSIIINLLFLYLYF